MNRRCVHFLLALLTAFALTACSGGGGGTPAEVGDDTYVPDFTAGSLKFTDVWVPDTAESSHPVEIWFDVEAEAPKYNVYVKLDLIKLPEGNASDLVIDPAAYAPDFELTGFVIDSAVVGDASSAPEDPQPLILEPGQKYHVEKTFTMPEGIPDGTYAAVFTINQEDYFPEDDSLQGEVDGTEEGKFMVAPASLIVGTPDLPNLRILSTELENHSFEFLGLEPLGPDSAYLSKDPVLQLNLEVESMAQDTTEPVDIVFDLNIGNQTFPLWFEVADASGTKTMSDLWTYGEVCDEFPVETPADGERGLDPQEKETVPSEVEEAQTETRCATLFRQSQVGHTYKLHLDAAAAAALETLTGDTPCELVITMTSAQAEYKNNVSDNTKTLSVVYLPPEPEEPTLQNKQTVQALAAVSPLSSSWETLLDRTQNGGFGNSWFGANYTASPEMKWQKNVLGKTVRGYSDLDFAARGKLFGKTNEILKVWQTTDMNLENIEGSYFDYGAEVYGTRIWGSRTYMRPEGDLQIKPMVLWKSEGKDGRERFAKRQDFFKRSYWYFPYGIPVNVTARAYGEVGLRGQVFIDPMNTLGIETGPYVNASGELEGAVSVAVARAGVGGRVKLIELYQKARGTLQLQPDMPLAIAKFEAPLEVSSLSGRLYLFGERLKYRKWFKYFWKRRAYTLLSWGGWSKEFHHFNPIVKSYSTREFDVEYYDNTALSGSPVTGKETAIDHSWYRSGPEKLGGQRTNFSARWTGTFPFQAGTYTFAALTDDGFRLYVDGVKVLDEWHGQAATPYEVPVSMTAGDHEIKVEYYQGGGGAVVKLLWYKNN